MNKTIDNVRILVLNTRGCNPWNDYKGEMLIKACQELQVDIALLNETNVKWTPGNLDKMKQRFSSIEREVLVKDADSGQWDITRQAYLPGGVVTAILGKARALVKDKIIKSPLGNWMACTLSHKDKDIVIINIYRMPSTSPNGDRCSLTQYNLKDGKVKSPKEYRTEIFQQIKKYLSELKKVDDIIIGGDFNQHIANKEV